MRCPLCNSTDHRHLGNFGDRLFRTTTREFGLALCRSCGLRHLDPRPTPEEIPAFYPTTYWPDAQSGLHGRLTEAYRRLVLINHALFLGRIYREQRSRGLTVHHLDAGCGDGSVLAACPAGLQLPIP